MLFNDVYPAGLRHGQSDWRYAPPLCHQILGLFSCACARTHVRGWWYRELGVWHFWNCGRATTPPTSLLPSTWANFKPRMSEHEKCRGTQSARLNPLKYVVNNYYNCNYTGTNLVTFGRTFADVDFCDGAKLSGKTLAVITEIFALFCRLKANFLYLAFIIFDN